MAKTTKTENSTSDTLNDTMRQAAEGLKAAGRFYECFETPVELDFGQVEKI